MTGRVLAMTPGEFALSLTVPRDVRFVPLVRDVANQVATYSEMDAARGKAFADHVAAAIERVLKHGHHGPTCDVHFTCEHGEVSVTASGETVRQRVAS
jgi:hypothetical protein